MTSASRRSRARQPIMPSSSPHTGEDEVSMPGGQGGGVLRLGHVPMEVALAEQLPGAQSQDGAGLLKTDPLGS